MNTTREQKIIYIAIAATIVAFLIGFLWQYTRARSLDQNLTQVRNELIFKRLEGTLAAATIEADRGNFEIARQLSSEFFTGLQRNIGQAPEAVRSQLTAINGQRDAIITSASRADPQTRSMLAQLYNTFRVAFGDAPVGIQPAPGAPAETTTTTTQ